MITQLQQILQAKNIKSVNLTGNQLNLPQFLAIAQHGAQVKVQEQNMQQSVALLNNLINQYGGLYGVTTGFGGSADTSTNELKKLQMSLISFLNVGFNTLLSDEVVRGMMCLRINTLVKGNSACGFNVVSNICHLLNQNILPEVPERGSISASGDLIPLSYLGGLLIGKQGIFAKVNGKSLNSIDALKVAGLTNITLQPKEGLAIVNGTAPSNAIAAISYCNTFILLVLSQVLTALSVQAMEGDRQSFSAFIGEIRPHPGQIEVGETIHWLLKGSQILENPQFTGLIQDRYHLRTAPQWLGPQLEILNSAIKTIEIEMNSTTDNPVFDTLTSKSYHGGNFQASSIAVSMDQMRMVLQHIGKITFAQHSELVNKHMNKKLPPNLSFTEPSTDYSFKGTDISMAAYMSELSYLANTVTNHVQSAELHNQSIYSLALVSGRYTKQAIEVCQMMLAVHLYTALQAIDLRIIQRQFVDQILVFAAEQLAQILKNCDKEDRLQSVGFKNLMQEIAIKCKTKQTLNSNQRFSVIFSGGRFFQYFCELLDKQSNIIQLFDEWKSEITQKAYELHKEVKQLYRDDYEVVYPYLGNVGFLYKYVRNVINIKMYRNQYDKDSFTLGQQIEILFKSIQNQDIVPCLLECLTAQNYEENTLQQQMAPKL